MPGVCLFVCVFSCLLCCDAAHSLSLPLVADRGQGWPLQRCLLADTGEARVRLRWAELRERLRAAEGALQRQDADARPPGTLPRWVVEEVWGGHRGPMDASLSFRRPVAAPLTSLSLFAR